MRVGDDLILVSVATERYLVSVTYKKNKISEENSCKLRKKNSRLVSAYDERERPVGRKRVFSRDALVGAAIWHRYQQDEVRRLRFRRRRVEILPWRGRVLDDTVDMESSTQPKVISRSSMHIREKTIFFITARIA